MSDLAALQELAARVEQQERRLAALEADRKITDTLYQYCHSIDYGDEAAWLDCFTEDASWYWTVRDRTIQAAIEAQGFGTVPIGTVWNRTGSVGPPPEGALVGREMLARMVAAHTRAPGRWHKHCVCDTRIRVEGDVAYADSYFVRVDGYTDSGEAYLRAFGRYLDDFALCHDGKWRIRHRRCEVEGHFDEAMRLEAVPSRPVS